jgi:hypothetical protein
MSHLISCVQPWWPWITWWTWRSRWSWFIPWSNRLNFPTHRSAPPLSTHCTKPSTPHLLLPSVAVV